jgi:hypothetical protein
MIFPMKIETKYMGLGRELYYKKLFQGLPRKEVNQCKSELDWCARPYWGNCG